MVEAGGERRMLWGTNPMLERFEGPDGQRRLVEALASQLIATGSTDIAAALAESGRLRAVVEGERIIAEGAFDDGMFLVVAGSLAILVGGKQVASRGPGVHVGEIASTDAAQPRSADVVAEAPSVVLELDVASFNRVADAHPKLWKPLALEASRRLVQRNRLVGKTNEQARAFVMSSAEGLPVAREIQSGLSHENVMVVVWTNGVFLASQYPLESLEEELEAADFAIAVVHPDDVTETRGASQRTPRDNVVFELGLFVGRLGRERTLLVEPRSDPAKLPSDLKGLTTIGYRTGAPREMPALLGPACTEVSKIIQRLGPK